MELSFQSSDITYLQPTVQDMRNQEETAEIIVPDSYPDVERILYCTASVILRSKECRTGSVLLSGGIRAVALYAPEDHSEPRALETYIPFSLRADQAAAGEQTQYLVQMFVRSADARMMNSRKVLFRVNFGCELKGFEEKTETLYTLQDHPTQLQLRKQTYSLLLPAELAEKSFSVSDEANIPSTKPAPDRIICYDTVPYVTDQKLSGNKAVFKGRLLLHLLYRAENGSLQTCDLQLPFSQYCELMRDYGEEELDVCMSVNGAEVEQSPSDPAKLLVTVHLLAQCLVRAAQKAELCEDAYAVHGSFRPEWKQYCLDCRLDRQSFRENLSCELPVEAASVVDSTAYLDFAEQSRSAGKMQFRIPASVQMLYYDKDGELAGTTGKTDLMIETALSDTAACSVETAAEGGGYAAVTPHGVELRYDVQVQVTSSAEQKLKTLCGGTLECRDGRDPERPAVVLRAAREYTPVWDLAREYGTTVSAIVQANHLTGDTVDAGTMLLIPL